jgi:hypothetical protein
MTDDAPVPPSDPFVEEAGRDRPLTPRDGRRREPVSQSSAPDLDTADDTD